MNQKLFVYILCDGAYSVQIYQDMVLSLSKLGVTVYLVSTPVASAQEVPLFIHSF